MHVDFVLLSSVIFILFLITFFCWCKINMYLSVCVHILSLFREKLVLHVFVINQLGYGRSIVVKC
jgi:hypothetical protein